jgi:hypothetical protein
MRKKDNTKLAIEQGRDEMRKCFVDLVHGDLSLARFSEVMKLDPNDIAAKIIFAPRLGKAEAPPVRALLCKVGQVDGVGKVLTAASVVEIAEAYEKMGVPVELNTAGELWTKL